MATRATVSRFAPALLRARGAAPAAAPSLLARRAALARGYASESEHSVSLDRLCLGRPNHVELTQLSFVFALLPAGPRMAR